MYGLAMTRRWLSLPCVWVNLQHFASAAGDKNSRSWNLKHNVIESINELLEGFEEYHSEVAEQALEHIHQK